MKSKRRSTTVQNENSNVHREWCHCRQCQPYHPSERGFWDVRSFGFALFLVVMIVGGIASMRGF